MKNLIFLHGALGHSSLFDELSNLLSKDFKVHSLLFRDHGIDNISDKAFNIPRLVEELDHFIKEHKIENPYIFGYSMGGYVALCHSIEHKDSIAKVATLATKFDWSPEIAIKETSFLNAEIIEKKIPAYAKQLQETHGESWKDLLSKTRELMIDIGSEKYLCDKTIHQIKIPVQLMLGDSDKMVSLQETIAARHLLEKGSLAILPNTKHPFENVNVEILAVLLRQFFPEK